MNLSEIDTKVTKLTKANTTDYPNANRLIDLNIWNQKVVTWILSSQDSSDFQDANYTGYSVLYQTLTTGRRDYEFGVSDAVVAIKRVEISYDGVTSYRSTPVDSSQINVGLQESYTDIDNQFSTTAPGHDWKYNALFIYPVPTADTGRIEVEVSRAAKDFTSAQYTTGTATPGFDLNFHPILAYGMAYEYFISNDMETKAAKMVDVINDYRASIKVQYGKKEQDFPLNLSSDYENYN